MNPSAESSSHARAQEADLLRGARSGDLDAFNALVELHERLVYNLCLRMLGNRAHAEDAAQETFISAFRHIRSCQGDRFRPWLLRIASNACTDELRRRGRRPAVSLDAPTPLDEAPAEPPDRGEGPEAAALRAEQRREIAAALLRLPRDQRLAVVLCDVHGLAYDEIAAATGASLGTVKSRIARGREKLRQELAAREQSGRAERPRS